MSHECSGVNAEYVDIIKEDGVWGISDDYPYHLIPNLKYCPFCGDKLE